MHRKKYNENSCFDTVAFGQEPAPDPELREFPLELGVLPEDRLFCSRNLPDVPCAFARVEGASCRPKTAEEEAEDNGGIPDGPPLDDPACTNGFKPFEDLSFHTVRPADKACWFTILLGDAPVMAGELDEGSN